MGYPVREGEADATLSAPVPEPVRAGEEARPGTVRRAVPVLVVLGLYLLLAGWADAHQWIDPYHRISGHLPIDNVQAEWFLSHAARGLTHPGDLLLDRQLNAPDGVN